MKRNRVKELVGLARVKIYELAKELSVESKDIVRKLHKMGIDVKSHMSSISNEEADMIRNFLARSGKESVTQTSNESFVPRVKRIPKAVVEQEQSLENGDLEQPAAVNASESKTAANIATSNTSSTTIVPAAQQPAAQQPAAQPAPVQQTAVNKEIQAPATPTAPLRQPTDKDKPQAQSTTVQQPTAAAIEKTTQEASNKPAADHNSPINEDQPISSAPTKAAPATQEQTAASSPSLPSPKETGVKTAASTGQESPTGGYRRDGQSNQSGGYRRDGQSNQSGGYRQDGQNNQTGGYRRDGQNNQTGGYRRDGQNNQTGGYRRDGQSNQSGGYRRDGGYGKDKDEESQNNYRKEQNKRGHGGKSMGGMSMNAPILEKPSANYRPNPKKPSVKDMVLEKASAEEKQRGNKNFNKNKANRKDSKNKKEAKMVMPPVTPKKITIGETVVLGELAKTMGKTAGEIIKKLFTMGIMATINQEIDSDTAILLADEFGVTVEVKEDKAAMILDDTLDDEKDLQLRPPVVTIMGHVDHGKTSLLDAIRHTNVISTEAGGITQHIGAYQVEIKGRKITFLDTPGHEAFTAMRARGAQVTDIVIIVVAADDGVMPQTIEAINHSKAAGVPIIIAINKIDKPGANPDRVKQELMEHGLVPEEWGGDTVMVNVSAKAKINLENLLEMILLVADVNELKANPNRQARGTVVEAKLDKNRGPVATLLVQKGTLHSGDNILAGAVFGKVRAMSDDKGNKVRHAGPSMPVEILGFSEVPPAGEIFVAVKDEKDARAVAARLQSKKREEELHKTARVSLDDLFKQIAEGEIQELNLVVKADVQGSVEALTQSLYKLNTDEVKVNVIHSGVGGVSESDVMLAAASNAIILGFNIVAPAAARTAAESENVDIRLYRVIYDALEDIKKAMSGLLAPEYKENIIGHAEVRAVFKVPKAGMVAGAYITQGKVSRNAQIRVIRDNIVIAEDKISSLRRFKDDAKEVLQGFECGIGLENFNDIKEGDTFEAFIMEEIERKL